MAEIVAKLKLGKRYCVTVQGLFETRAGDTVKDEAGRTFQVISIGMPSYVKPANIKEFTELLLEGEANIGSRIK